MGDLPRIELFARKRTPGWDVWGDEAEDSKEEVFTLDRRIGL
jgi:N6-adenosine-specific RNA methylase IME4